MKKQVLTNNYEQRCGNNTMYNYDFMVGNFSLGYFRYTHLN